ncbi:MAG TPA: glycosyltransferase family 2 protein [Bacteroidales bacterium]|nr:glycosyltransferase family 2 protein [Bacteroidales bacterium]HOX79217.1 glycosyltransferase family 2 protein [Bacteroidales bacterium]HPI86475.1 glycosyltransferase family 2 protein [Bacteroidales bacterium]HPM91367.1 glycosyltransferase family 2 protein [Bacteroidales bacterium]
MKKILVIVPAFNESENIREVISKLHSENAGWDILVINDASEDKTSEIARATGQAEVIDLPFNLGIGGCVQTGFRYARRNGYDFALQFDGDGQHSADEIHKLLELVRSGEADVAIGSRFRQKHDGFKSSSSRRMGIRIFEWFSFILIRQRITDHTSGFRAYNRKALKFLADYYPSDYPEPEVVILLGRNGFTIRETFTQMHERKGGVSSIPITKGPYYMIKVMLSMFMSAIRSKVYRYE